MKNLSKEELMNAATESGKEFLKSINDPKEIFELEKRICILTLKLPKIFWFALEDFCKHTETLPNEVLSSLCNGLLLEQDIEIQIISGLRKEN